MPENAKVSFYIVDDHPVTRHGLRVSLESLSDEMVYRGEAGSAEEALTFFEGNTVDFVVLDHALPGKSGLDLVAELRQKAPHVRFSLLTQCDDSGVLAQYQKLGVRVMVAKISASDVLKEAIQSLLKERSYICPVIRKLLEEPRLTSVLTPREIEVIRMIAQGKTNKEVALALGCSEHTIKTHKTNVMRKLNLSNAVEISVWALKRNLA